MTARTMAEFIRLNKRRGQHWFDRDTIRFFQSRFGPLVKGRYFISSEKSPYDVRKWSIRKVNWKTGQVDTISEFGGFKTESQAKRRLSELM